jgi:hypothetical protein
MNFPFQNNKHLAGLFGWQVMPGMSSLCTDVLGVGRALKSPALILCSLNLDFYFGDCTRQNMALSASFSPCIQ